MAHVSQDQASSHSATSASLESYPPMRSFVSHLRDILSQVVVEDTARLAIFEDVVTLIEPFFTNEDHQNARLESPRSSGTGMESLMEELSEYNQQLKMHLAARPFVFVVLDGNHFQFPIDLIEKGKEGGYEAAARFDSILKERVIGVNRRISRDLTVVVRLYIDIAKIAHGLRTIGAFDAAERLKSFLDGLGAANPLINVVDVPADDTMQTKLSNGIRLHLNDQYCSQIVLGLRPSPDLLRDLNIAIVEHGCLYSRITFLHHETLSIRFQELPLPHALVDDLFTNPTLGIESPSRSHAPNGRAVDLPLTPAKHSEPVIGKPPPPRTWASVAAAPPPPLPADDCPADDRPRAVAPSSWTAFKASSAATFSPLLPLESAVAIPRNRHNHRLDPKAQCDRVELKALQLRKLCNAHYLRDACPFGERCKYDHTYSPTLRETQLLRVSARMHPCVTGGKCEDPLCIYGHVCQVPAATGKSDSVVIGGKSRCLFGRDCKFPTEMHVVDLKRVE